jgi:hypothetical protein
VVASRNFGGKVGAHDPQKVGAEFRSARHELSQLLEVPLRQSSATARHHIHWTGQTAVSAHVADELTGSKRHSCLVAENGLDFPTNKANCVRYLLALLEGDLAWRAVDSLGEADQGREAGTSTC